MTYLCYMDRKFICDGRCCGFNLDGTPRRADGSGEREYEARMNMGTETIRKIEIDGVIITGPDAP
jgi:hypothetical protein